jgi:hypothetical protein
MERISRHFDRVSKQWSRNSAIAFIVIFSITFCLSVFGIVDYLRFGNLIGLWIGSLNCAVSVFNILIGTQILRGVDRPFQNGSPTEP